MSKEKFVPPKVIHKKEPTVIENLVKEGYRVSTQRWILDDKPLQQLVIFQVPGVDGEFSLTADEAIALASMLVKAACQIGDES